MISDSKIDYILRLCIQKLDFEKNVVSKKVLTFEGWRFQLVGEG